MVTGLCVLLFSSRLFPVLTFPLQRRTRPRSAPSPSSTPYAPPCPPRATPANDLTASSSPSRTADPTSSKPALPISLASGSRPATTGPPDSRRSLCREESPTWSTAGIAPSLLRRARTTTTSTRRSPASGAATVESVEPSRPSATAAAADPTTATTTASTLTTGSHLKSRSRRATSQRRYSSMRSVVTVTSFRSSSLCTPLFVPP